ncbi:hypothetical protein G1K46_12495, partial [Tenacibaculum finnmarkense]|uniref:beta strand repeat-containing protein n=2 Tax=Tenacibaculum finnmarkense TaxID=2781243 RepID=UPI001EFC23B6
VTFNPDAGFTQTPTDISYTLTETSTGKTNDATITAAYTEVDPIANDDTNTTPGTPGVDVSIALLPNDDLSDGSQATVSNTSIKLIAPKGGTLNADGTVTIPNEGTWTLDPLTGIVTFDPEPGFTQAPATIDYQLTETSTGLTDNATITAAYTEADPIANNDTNTTPGTPGVNVTIPLLPNDDLSDGTQATVDNTSIVLIDPVTSLPSATPNEVIVVGEGTWTLDPVTDIVTFDPEPGFTQAPATIDYQLTETSTGLTDNATITAAYTEADPIANNDTNTTPGTPGVNVTIPLLPNDDLSDGTQATVSNTSIELIDPATGIATTTPNVVTVANEGVWTVDPATGELTFNPDAGFTTNPTDITYTLIEVSTNLTDTAVVNVEYTFVAPVATDDASTGNVPGADTTLNLLDNDKLSDGSPISTTDASSQVTIDLDPATAGIQSTVTVANEGVWTVDPATGELTFNPDAGFTTNPTDITYTLIEVSTNLTDTAVVNVEYTFVAPVATDDASTGNVPGADTTLNLLDNDKLSDGSPISTTDASSQVTIDLDPATAGIQSTVTVANEGVWTVDPATGELTFNPDAGFTTNPTDITYTLTEVSTNLTDTAVVNVEYTFVAPVATDDSSTGNTPGDDATIDVLDNDKLSDGSPITDPSTQVTIDLDPTTTGVQNTLVVPNEGTWTVDPLTGIVTFNPDAGFTQTPTDISYTLTETSTGLSDTATVKAGYDEGNPIATDDTVTGNTP